MQVPIKFLSIPQLSAVPDLIDEIAKNFGSQVCVLAVDAKQTERDGSATLNGGRMETDKDLFEWTKEAQERGAGEILFTSMNHDGVKDRLCQ